MKKEAGRIQNAQWFQEHKLPLLAVKEGAGRWIKRGLGWIKKGCPV